MHSKVSAAGLIAVLKVMMHKGSSKNWFIWWRYRIYSWEGQVLQPNKRWVNITLGRSWWSINPKGDTPNLPNSLPLPTPSTHCLAPVTIIPSFLSFSTARAPLKRISQRGFDYLRTEYPASNQIYIEPRSRIMFPRSLLFLANNIKVASSRDRRWKLIMINGDAISSDSDGRTQEHSIGSLSTIKLYPTFIFS